MSNDPATVEVCDSAKKPDSQGKPEESNRCESSKISKLRCSLRRFRIFWWPENRMRIFSALSGCVALLLFCGLCYLLIFGDTDSYSAHGKFLFVLLFMVAVAALCLVGCFGRQRKHHRAYEFVLGVVAIGVVGLTFIGYSASSPDIPIFTQLYYAALFFTGGSPDGEPPTTGGVALRLAQYGGVIVLFGAVFRLLSELLSHPFTRAWAIFASKIVLVAGLNETSLPVIRALAEDSGKAKVLVIEPNPKHPLLPQLRRIGVRVVISDISDRRGDLIRLKEVLARAFPWRFRFDIGGRSKVALYKAYLLSDDDLINIANAEVIRRTLKDIESGDASADAGVEVDGGHLVPPRLIVRIDRYRRGRSYVAEQAKEWEKAASARVFISTIGVNQMTAQALVHHIIVRGKVDKVLVVGEGDRVEAFCTEWRLWSKEAAFAGEGGESPTSTSSPDQKPDSSVDGGTDSVEHIGWDDLADAVQARSGRPDRFSVVLVSEPDAAQLRDLESMAMSLDGDKVRIFVPRQGTGGIARYPVMGCLQFYTPSLGGLEKDCSYPEPGGGGAPGAEVEASPLEGVPTDAWLRAARLISRRYRSSGRRYNQSSDVQDDQLVDLADAESSLRSIWGTLKNLSADGYRWEADASSEDRTVQSVRLSEACLSREHESWYLYKKHLGGIRSDWSCSRCLRNDLMYPWGELQSNPALADRFEKVDRRTEKSIRLNLAALAVLGFFAVPWEQDQPTGSAAGRSCPSGSIESS